MRSKWLLSLLVLGAFAAAPMHAAEEKKPEAKKEEKKEEKAERLWPRGPEMKNTI